MVALHRVSDVDDLISQAALKFIDTVARIQTAGGGLHHDGIARVVLTGGSAGIGVLHELARLDFAHSNRVKTSPRSESIGRAYTYSLVMSAMCP